MVQNSIKAAKAYILGNALRRDMAFDEFLQLEQQLVRQGQRPARFPCLHGINLPKVASTPRNCLGQVLATVRPGAL
jgi:hypothetical protein